jgi:alginate O-acetyltransferase complex protein AlgI
MFGFELLENFNFPYIANSIQDFWRRWHISLSTWFRDYLYIPLGGNRAGKHRVYFNLFVVFLLTGFWHGASWNFIVWGLFHGLFLIIERIGFGRFLEKLWSPVRHFYTLFVVLISWVFFRANDLSYAISYLKTMFGARDIDSGLWMINKYITTDVGIALIIALIGSTTILLFIQQYFIQQFMQIKSKFWRRSVPYVTETIAGIGLFSIFLLSVMYLMSNTYNPFIYFRF